MRTSFPWQGIRHQAGGLRGMVLFGILLASLPALGQIPFHLQQSPGKPLSPKQLSSEAETRVFELTNEGRAKKKLANLIEEDLLAQLARGHSRDMLERNYLSHFSPEGKSLVDRYKSKVGNARRSLGENVHMIESSQGLWDASAIAKTMLADWMRSPTHRKNLLSKDYLFLGVGCAADQTRIFCTQVFAGPKFR